ncbi:hypothetical protein ALC60_06526 [Trachymyrmex zeteki]|uniref:Uncharacterized protein n=1 Tax=Mycetomoellerius zeteki TaxID=64791 RepID=A0A151X2X8_9HYME|nr:hypothetical protein ALC60_06526 [Trachymyrmex zeteki]
MKILFARNKDSYNIYRERKAMFKMREKEKRSAIEMERSRNEVANVHPSPYSLPPLTTPLHINPPLIRVESIARACVCDFSSPFISCILRCHCLVLNSILSLALIRSRFHGPNTPPLRWPQDSPGVGRNVKQGGVVTVLKLRADLFLSVPPQYIMVAWQGVWQNIEIVKRNGEGTGKQRGDLCRYGTMGPLLQRLLDLQYWGAAVNLGESRKTNQPVSDFGGRHLPLSSISFASRENLLAICPPFYSPRLLFTPGIEQREEGGIVSGDATRGCIRTSNNINDGVAWVVGSTAWTRKIGRGEVGRGCLCR